MNIEVFLSAVSGAGFVAIVVAFWAKSYFGRYLAKKAENLATHEDIHKLVNQVRETERVKAEIADRMWDRQRRWDAKKDLYLEAYSSLHQIYDHLINVGEGRRRALHIDGFDRTLLADAIGQLRSDFDKLGHVSFVAPLFFSDSAARSLWNISGSAKTWMAMVDSDGPLNADELAKAQEEFEQKFNAAIADFVVRARRDLGYPSDSASV